MNKNIRIGQCAEIKGKKVILVESDYDTCLGCCFNGYGSKCEAATYCSYGTIFKEVKQEITTSCQEPTKKVLTEETRESLSSLKEEDLVCIDGIKLYLCLGEKESCEGCVFRYSDGQYAEGQEYCSDITVLKEYNEYYKYLTTNEEINTREKVQAEMKSRFPGATYVRQNLAREGWICPRCEKVLSPFMPSCDCRPETTIK